MLIFADHDVLWQAVIAGVVTVVLAVMSNRSKTAADRAALEAEMSRMDIAEKVEEVKITQQHTDIKTTIKLDNMAGAIDEVKTTGDKIHTLTNSANLATLEAVMVALRRISELTDLPMDLEAYEAAKKVYEEHRRSQNVVDQKFK